MVEKVDGPFNGAGSGDVVIGVPMEGGKILEGKVTVEDLNTIASVIAQIGSPESEKHAAKAKIPLLLTNPISPAVPKPPK